MGKIRVTVNCNGGIGVLSNKDMQKFTEGQRVSVPQSSQHAPTNLLGRAGTVNFVGPIVFDAGVASIVEPQYSVRFDGDELDQMVWESWLEPA